MCLFYIFITSHYIIELRLKYMLILTCKKNTQLKKFYQSYLYFYDLAKRF